MGQRRSIVDNHSWEYPKLFMEAGRVPVRHTPHTFVTDNGKQFDCNSFRKWCVELNIRNYFSMPMHPQENGQVEASNKTLMTIEKIELTSKIKQVCVCAMC
jgi:transposase InsO family protein